jgi:hypothetical protein
MAAPWTQTERRQSDILRYLSEGEDGGWSMWVEYAKERESLGHGDLADYARREGTSRGTGRETARLV